jgi:hypothetical protein
LDGVRARAPTPCKWRGTSVVLSGETQGHRGIVVKHAAAVSFWVAVHCPEG